MAVSIYDSKCAVVFLVINHIQDLPVLAINSVLQNSNSPIFIGTVREQDQEGLPVDSRITFIDLSSEAFELGLPVGTGIYESFEKDVFFSLVQLKWVLFRKVSAASSCDFLIYNDIDVFWLRPVLPDLLEAFEKSAATQLMIQHFTWVPGLPQLCMGFVAFRIGNYFDELIKDASDLHTQMLKSNPRSGDDDVITALYRRKHFPAEIQLLPQTTFPVGNLLNLFSKRDQFPGLQPFSPYIFHANFVVGLKKKLLITSIAYRQHNLDLRAVPFIKRLLMLLKLPTFRLYFNLRKIVKPK
ncbi:putative nucleotide-diphospho-sugar transferase [Candidatus Planktophila dulcis]|uniref:putative nucleotide-diphospho-sugar transferase n=1 Tax=Candidatus Planktophila dulcis TaxID=1884914 RepID=UPI003CF3CB9D